MIKLTKFLNFPGKSNEKCRYHIVQSSLSLTWPATMQMSQNKIRFYERKEFHPHRTGLGNQHGRRFIVLGNQYNIADVTLCYNSL